MQREAKGTQRKTTQRDARITALRALGEQHGELQLPVKEGLLSTALITCCHRGLRYSLLPFSLRYVTLCSSWRTTTGPGTGTSLSLHRSVVCALFVCVCMCVGCSLFAFSQPPSSRCWARSPLVTSSCRTCRWRTSWRCAAKRQSLCKVRLSLILCFVSCPLFLSCHQKSSVFPPLFFRFPSFALSLCLYTTYTLCHSRKCNVCLLQSAGRGSLHACGFVVSHVGSLSQSWFTFTILVCSQEARRPISWR